MAPRSTPLSVAIIGSGLWGTAFGHAIASDSCRIIFVDRSYEHAQQAASVENTVAQRNLTAAAAAADLIIVAVSTAAFSQTLAQLNAVKAPLIWLTKGFTPDSSKPLCEVAAQALGPDRCYGVISGPSFAQEVKQQLPAALSLAANCADTGNRIRRQLHRPHLRLYWQDDMIGTCIGGALKNIIAIATGISDGLQLGHNARAALMTRGLEEMNRFSALSGGKPETLLGLCGVGDLVLTCSSDLSRNRRLGLALAAGGGLADDITCEGVTAAAVVASAARAHGLDLPIINAVAAVLEGTLQPANAVQQLLARPLRV